MYPVEIEYLPQQEDTDLLNKTYYQERRNSPIPVRALAPRRPVLPRTPHTFPPSFVRVRSGTGVGDCATGAHGLGAVH